MKIQRFCPFSGERKTMNIAVTQEQLDRWRSGELIQRAMPNISAGEREFILSGITPDEWDNLFTEEQR